MINSTLSVCHMT